VENAVPLGGQIVAAKKSVETQQKMCPQKHISDGRPAIEAKMQARKDDEEIVSMRHERAGAGYGGPETPEKTATENASA
jgi:hypothetical protein